MRHDRLPPIFLKVWKRAQKATSVLKTVMEEVAPAILIHVDYGTIRKEHQKNPVLNYLELYSTFWVETDSEAHMCVFSAESKVLRVGSFDEKGMVIDSFAHPADENGLITRDMLLSSFRRTTFDFILVVMGLLTRHREGERTSVFTASRNKGSVYYSEGDVTKFKRIFDFKRLPSPEYSRPEPGSSGIRKKEHDVIGHWRHYPSGAKVWVKPHKRGDPSLGRVTSVFS